MELEVECGIPKFESFLNETVQFCGYIKVST